MRAIVYLTTYFSMHLHQLLGVQDKLLQDHALLTWGATDVGKKNAIRVRSTPRSGHSYGSQALNSLDYSQANDGVGSTCDYKNQYYNKHALLTWGATDVGKKTTIRVRSTPRSGSKLWFIN